MNRSLTYLRRGLLGTVIVGAFGFGATQAFATPALAAQYGSCLVTGYAYIPNDCPECPSGGGYCDGYNRECICFDVTEP